MKEGGGEEGAGGGGEGAEASALRGKKRPSPQLRWLGGVQVGVHAAALERAVSTKGGQPLCVGWVGLGLRGGAPRGNAKRQRGRQPWMRWW